MDGAGVRRAVRDVTLVAVVTGIMTLSLLVIGGLLLAPERVLTPDAIAVEVLQLCDGHRTLSAIAATLARRYAAPDEQIAADVAAMLQDLADKGFLYEMREEPK